MRLHVAAAVAVAVAVGPWAGGAQADDPAQQAHAIMRQALLDRAVRVPDATTSSRESTATARERMDRMRRAEAERAAHERAAEHGSKRSGVGRSDRETHGAPGSMHGGSGSWGMDCQDAAGNSRTKDMHDGGMPGGGMPRH